VYNKTGSDKDSPLGVAMTQLTSGAAMKWISSSKRRERLLQDQLRRNAYSRLDPGEQVLHEARVVYLDPVMQRQAYLLFTSSRFVIALNVNQPRVLSGHYAAISKIGHGEGAIVVTTQKEWGPLVSDPSNPNDELDYYLFYGAQAWVKDVFSDMTMELSTHFADWRQKLGRFKERRAEPLASWKSCPFCEEPLTVRVDHAASCESCGLLYADAGFEPRLSHDEAKFGTVVGADAVAQLSSEADTWSLVRPYEVMRAPNPKFDAMVLVDRELERRVAKFGSRSDEN
jgi:hypothetical protein